MTRSLTWMMVALTSCRSQLLCVFSHFSLLHVLISQKPKAKAAPKKPVASKAAPKKMTQTTLTTKPTGRPAAAKKRAESVSEDDMSDNDSVLSHTPPKKTKSVPASKKGGSKPLADVENESFGLDGAESKDTNSSDKYQKVGLTQCL